MSNHAFSWPIRVYWEDTDAGGVVYYANYLRFLERCRSEWLRDLGVNQLQMMERDNAQLVVRSVHCEYLKPAKLDDELVVTAAVSDLRRVSFTFLQTIERKGQLLIEAEVKAACIDATTLRLKRFPEPLAAILSPLV